MIDFALITLVLVGIGGPLVRVAERMGISPKDYILINFIVGPVISIMLMKGRGQPLFSSIIHTPKGALCAVIAAIALNLSFISSTIALHLPHGYVSVFYMITASSVIVSSVIGLLLLGESSKVNLTSWFTGASLILLGVFFVINSLKR